MFWARGAKKKKRDRVGRRDTKNQTEPNARFKDFFLAETMRTTFGSQITPAAPPPRPVEPIFFFFHKLQYSTSRISFSLVVSFTVEKNNNVNRPSVDWVLVFLSLCLSVRLSRLKKCGCNQGTDKGCVRRSRTSIIQIAIVDRLRREEKDTSCCCCCCHETKKHKVKHAHACSP